MLDTVKPSDWLTVAAILVGPIAAVVIQLYREKRAQSRNSQDWIFRTLMTNRGTALNYDYVRALNSIDIAFYGEKQVVGRWKKLNDHLNKITQNEAEALAWNETNRDLTAELLVEMGNTLGYTFDFSAIKESAYVPKGHATVEGELHSIRKKILDVLDGHRKLPVALFEEGFPPLVGPRA